MRNPQLVVRISPSLLEELNGYADKNGTSKTEVVITALADYLGCPEKMPLNQRVAALEAEIKELRALVKNS